MSAGIKAYDCRHPVSNITTVSLTSIKPCDRPILNKTTSQELFQLVQQKNFDHVNIKFCSIKVSISTWYCGMHSHISLLPNSQRVKFLEVSKIQCDRLHLGEQVSIFNLNIMMGVGKNYLSTTSIITGSLDKNGACSGGNLVLDGNEYKSAVVEITMEINLSKQKGNLDIQSGDLILPSGTSCSYHMEMCEDYQFGQGFWSRDDNLRSCSDTSYEVIYEGLIDLSTSLSSGITVQLASISSGTTLLMLQVTTPTGLCGQSAFHTEHPSLLLISPVRGTKEFYFKQKSINPENVDFPTYVNTKFVLLDKKWSLSLSEIYQEAYLKRCNLERKVLQQQLLQALSDPVLFAYSYFGEPGFFGVLGSEVVHLFKCRAVEVTIPDTKLCHQELEVLYDNRTYFMQPVTKILLPLGKEETCNPLVPSMFEFNGYWFTKNPQISRSLEPHILSPETLKMITIDDYDLAIRGMYPIPLLHQWQNRLIVGATMPAVARKIAIKVTGNNEPGHVVMNWDYMIPEHRLEERAKSIFSKMTDGIWWLGDITAHIAGLLLLLSIILWFINTILNAKTIHEQFGWTIKLVCSLWNGATAFIINRRNRVMELLRLEQEAVELEQVKVDVPSSLNTLPGGIYPNM